MTTTTTARKPTTRRIAGFDLTLTPGRTYLASRPFAGRGRKTYDVSITDITDGFPAGQPLAGTAGVTLAGLSYDEANRVLRLFNNGPVSFAGRVWK